VPKINREGQEGCEEVEKANLREFNQSINHE
jgi:hypothetical protein